MQEEKPEIIAALISGVVQLGILALAGLMLLAFMAGSVEAMRGVVAVAGMAYLSQACSAAAEWWPLSPRTMFNMRLASLLLWAGVIGLFVVALVLI